MNNVAGSKNPIMAEAAAGENTSSTVSTVNVQNIPNRALGNLMAAAAKALFREKSAARINPSDTARCKIPTTVGSPKVAAAVWGASELDDLTRAWRRLERIAKGLVGV